MQRNFSTALKMTLMDKFTRIDTFKDPVTQQLSMQINLVQPAKLSFSKDTTLDFFREQLNACGASEVDFFTMNGSKIPLCERVDDL